MVQRGRYMNFTEFIAKNSQVLSENWFKWMINHYPEPSKKYLLKIDQPFTNPVGYNIYTNLNKLMELLSKNEIDSKEFDEALEEILKIRTVQGIDHWQAINIFEYLWDKFIEEAPKISTIEEIVNSVDYYQALLSKSLNIFVEIKEKIAEIQKNEIRNRYGNILERLNEKYSYTKYKED
jgi:hypothetical protein